MSNTLRLLASLLLGMLATQDGVAQWNVARYATGRNRIYTTFGMDPALVTAVGYGRVFPFLGRAWQLSGEFGIGAAEFDTRDFRARMQLHSTIVGWRSARLTGAATFITRGTENSIYRGLNFGADFTGTAGVYRSGWFAAAEVGFDKAIVTHITHSDWYRTWFYPGAKDGWYLDAGGIWHYGLVGGVGLGPAELAARIGFRRTENFEELTPPAYLAMGIGFRF
jgi:hypothetical protein